MRYVHTLMGVGFMGLALFYAYLLQSSQTQISPSLGAFGAPLVPIVVFAFGLYLAVRGSARPALARSAAVSRIVALGGLAAMLFSAAFGSHFGTGDRVLLLLVGTVVGTVTALLLRAGPR